MPPSLHLGTILKVGSLPNATGALAEYYQQLAEEHRAILDALETAIGLVQKHRIVWVNRAFVSMFGYSLAEARRLRLADCFDDATQLERIQCEYSSVVSGGGTYQTDVVMRRKNGETFWGNARGRLLFPERSDAGCVWMLMDISERMRVETKLRRSEVRLLTAQTQARICTWEQGRNPNDRYWSEELFGLLGFDPALSFPTNAAILERFDARDREQLIAAQHRAAETGELVRLICRSNTEFGPLRYFEATMAPQFDEAGRFLRQVGTLQDVTERELNEEALKLGQCRFEAAQAQARIGNWELGPNLEPTYWSKQMFVMFGFDPELGVPPIDEYHRGVHPEDRSALDEGPRRAIESRQPYRCVHRTHPSTGEPRYFEVTMVPAFDERGQLLRMTGTTQDVTERILADQALRWSESRLVRAQTQAKIGSWEFNPTTGDLLYSKEMYHLLGQDPQAGPPGSADWQTGFAPQERERFYNAYRRAIESQHPITFEFRRIAQSGTPDRCFETTMEAVRDDAGKVLHIAGTLQDVTERKQAERERSKLQEQLGQALKMEAIGRLAGGVAHDFNNLLTVISGNVEFCLEGLDRQDPLAEYLKGIGDAANRASSLTQQLLAFSRRQLTEPRVVNLNELIHNLQKMLGRLIGEDIQLELRLESELGAVRIDPGQFDQVVLNLAVNARDAMPRGGRLTIETTNVELDDAYCQMHHGLTPGAFVSLVVSDSGEGMPPEVMRHIFEPFFTTKPAGTGTGLGLSVIFGVVKQAGGTIETYSELGLGTTFKIYLPRVDAPAQSIERAPTTVEVPRGTETILLVEDNSIVRQVTSTMLDRLGYRVLVAEDGNSALGLLKAEGSSIDLLLTDLVMPQMSGHELSRHVHEFYPEVPVLYCSGYTEDTFVRHGLASEELQFIGKPFTQRQVAQKVRQVLDDARKRGNHFDQGSPRGEPG